MLLALITPLSAAGRSGCDRHAEPLSAAVSGGRILGTDHLGRDLLSRLLWGTRLSPGRGLAAAIIAATIGAAIGIIAGFYGGRTDNLIMRGVDMLMAFPYILLALAIVAALGPGLMNALIAVAAVNVPFFARNIRGITVGIAHKEFVDAARLAGMATASIILTEVLPNVLPVIVIAMSTTIGWMILETAGLSFLGLGSQPPQADLGLDAGRGALGPDHQPAHLCRARRDDPDHRHGINLLGDGVRDALGPAPEIRRAEPSDARHHRWNVRGLCLPPTPTACSISPDCRPSSMSTTACTRPSAGSICTWRKANASASSAKAGRANRSQRLA